MVACNFDMQFIFVWAGREGSAYDTRIFIEALYNPNIKFPKPPESINKLKYVMLFISRRGNFIYIIDKYLTKFIDVIPRKYYLVNSGYPNEYGFLGPYRG
jgi:hypothetical protein